MKMTKLQFAFLLFLLANAVANAQITVKYGNKIVKRNSEVLKASVGTYGDSFSFEISEHDMSPNGPWAKKVKRLEAMGKIVNPADAPKGLFLSLEVNFKNKFKFPIEPKDSVVLSLSTLKQNLLEKDFQDQQISGIDGGKMKSDANPLNQKKKSVEAEAKRISKLMMEGKMSPEEAGRKLEALANSMTAQTNAALAPVENLEEFKERSNYSLNFLDTNENIEADIFSGSLHIVEFNKKRLVAYIKGVQIVKCIDVKRQNDENSGCHKPSKFLPGLDVFDESEVYISINTRFKQFDDFRTY